MPGSAMMPRADAGAADVQPSRLLFRFRHQVGEAAERRVGAHEQPARILDDIGDEGEVAHAVVHLAFDRQHDQARCLRSADRVAIRHRRGDALEGQLAARGGAVDDHHGGVAEPRCHVGDDGAGIGIDAPPAGPATMIWIGRSGQAARVKRGAAKPDAIPIRARLRRRNILGLLRPLFRGTCERLRY
jgi:hypothetical protein